MNALNQLGFTLLMNSSMWGHLNQVEFLLEKGADVNEGGKLNNSPLFYAALSGRREIAEKLNWRMPAASGNILCRVTLIPDRQTVALSL